MDSRLGASDIQECKDYHMTQLNQFEKMDDKTAAFMYKMIVQSTRSLLENKTLREQSNQMTDNFFGLIEQKADHPLTAEERAGLTKMKEMAKDRQLQDASYENDTMKMTGRTLELIGRNMAPMTAEQEAIMKERMRHLEETDFEPDFQ